MTRDETTWTWWTLPPPISGCLARPQVHPGLFLSMLNEPEHGQPRPGSGQVGRTSARGIRGPGARGPASARVQRRHSVADTSVPMLAPAGRADWSLCVDGKAEAPRCPRLALVRECFNWSLLGVVKRVNLEIEKIIVF
jgi:hypothetical protein